ncbi:hypothetical protein L6452_26502 [Arctium lappa]|uniref:Uncharacterized protein n=1 Tax=Arctium lappa TaxID=4217 RepID=A0ACB8ZUQ0_ARCLA|nr:hypothetical protein L6452_26502 [Arctium lappa]
MCMVIYLFSFSLSNLRKSSFRCHKGWSRLCLHDSALGTILDLYRGVGCGRDCAFVIVPMAQSSGTIAWDVPNDDDDDGLWDVMSNDDGTSSHKFLQKQQFLWQDSCGGAVLLKLAEEQALAEGRVRRSKVVAWELKSVTDQPRKMKDVVAVVPGFMSRKHGHAGGFGNLPPIHFFGIYDGHGDFGL